MLCVPGYQMAFHMGCHLVEYFIILVSKFNIQSKGCTQPVPLSLLNT